MFLAVEDPSILKNYWILQLPYDCEFDILGTTIMPSTLDPEDEKHNIEVLLKGLNSGDCFDVILDVNEKDILDLHFNCEGNDLIYAFVFENGKWGLGEYDPFGSVAEVESGDLRIEVGSRRSEVCPDFRHWKAPACR